MTGNESLLLKFWEQMPKNIRTIIKTIRYDMSNFEFYLSYASSYLHNLDTSAGLVKNDTSENGKGKAPIQLQKNKSKLLETFQCMLNKY